MPSLRTTSAARLFLLFFFSLGIFIFCSFCVAGEERDEGITEIVLLHTNDLHFNFNHRQAFEKQVERYRRQYDNVYLLDAGDMFTRHRRRWPEDSLDFYERRSRFMIETMNELAYDAAVLGNHELDYHGPLTRESLCLARFPLLGANVEVSTEKFDQPEPYIVLDTDCGHTLFVLGLTTGGADGVRTSNAAGTVEKYLDKAAEKDIFVLLTHLGYSQDKKLAEKFDEIDVIIGGHTHTHVNPARKVNNALVAQTGGHVHYVRPDNMQHLGAVQILLVNGEIQKMSGRVMSFDSSSDSYRSIEGVFDPRELMNLIRTMRRMRR